MSLLVQCLLAPGVGHCSLASLDTGLPSMVTALSQGLVLISLL